MVQVTAPISGRLRRPIVVPHGTACLSCASSDVFRTTVNERAGFSVRLVKRSETGYGQSNIFILDTRNTTGVQNKAKIPEDFILHQNYPNPFNPVTTIQFDLPKPGRAAIKIYNVLGQDVKTLFDDLKTAGYHSIKWDGTNEFGNRVASGMYIYRVASEFGIKSRKMVIIK